MKKIISFLFMLLLACSASAQFTWHYGPGGGYFKDFAFHPQNQQIVFAGSDDSGGLWKSTDGGLTWTEICWDSASANYRNVTGWSINIDPLHPDTIWVCEFYGRHGLLRSTDGGNTWTNPVNGLNTIYDKMVRSLVYGSPAGDTLLICTGESATSTPPRPGNGIFRSVNGGQSWQPSGLQGTSVPVMCKTILGTVFAGTAGSGLHYSNDNGSNWFIHPGLPANLAVNDLETEGQFVVVASPSGVFLSIDYGINFTNIGLAADVNFDVDIEKTSPSLQLLCATYAGLQRYSSSNGLWSLVSDPEINGRLVMGLESRDSVIFVSTFTNSLILRSTNSGLSFQKIAGSPISTEVADFEFIHPMAHFFIATMLGTYGIPGLGNAPCIRVKNNISNNTNWVERGPQSHGICLARNPNLYNEYFLGTFNEGLFFTTDTFITYTNIRPGNKLITDIAVSPANTQQVMIGEVDWTANTWGLYRSVNSGTSFSPVLNEVINQVYYHPIHRDTVFAATMNGVWMSSDSGASWTSYGLQGADVKSIGWTAQTGLAAGTSTGLLYQYAGSVPQPVTAPYSGQNRVRAVYPLFNGGIVVAIGGSEMDTTYNLNGGAWLTYDFVNWQPAFSGLKHNNNFYGNGCVKSINCNRAISCYGGGIYSEFNCVGMDEISAATIAPVYPNPVKNLTVLHLPLVPEKVVITDLQGKLVQSERTSSSEFRIHAEAGMYFIHLFTKEGNCHIQQIIVTE